MDYFQMAADLPRENYCKRQQEGGVCQTRTQCIHCELYAQGLLPAHYPVPNAQGALIRTTSFGGPVLFFYTLQVWSLGEKENG